jgi:sugar transferase (PEP-CTERM system associated)
MRIFGVHFSRVALAIFTSEYILFFAVSWMIVQTTLGHTDSGLVRLLLLSFLFASTLVLIFSSLGLYRDGYRLISQQTLEQITIGAILAGVVTAGVVPLAFNGQLPNQATWSWLAGAPVAAAVVAAGARALGRRIAFVVQSLRPRALVLGTGEQARTVAEAVAKRSSTRLVGYMTIAGRNTATTPLDDPAMVVPWQADVANAARARRANEIIVALDDRRGTLPVQELLHCRIQGLRVVDAVSFLERETGRVDVDVVRPSWLIFSEGFTKNIVHDVVKRSFDIGVAVFGLMLAAPLFALLIPAIRLESPGPAFYTQKRVGLGGRAFTMIKFRSMRHDAERAGRAQWASAGDPRITRLGRWLRRTRLDELPQLVNVLRGDMSFIGPRPERPEFVTELAADIPYYNERHRIRPGLTGWAQVNYKYGSSIDDAREKLRYDLYYLKNRNLFLDFVILSQTLRIVVSGEGAH